MDFVAISDTHRRHRKLRDLPKADAIVHAGDISSRGTLEEIDDFLRWFDGLDYRYKIFIAGNHDFLFEQAGPELLRDLIPPGITYLNDSGVTVEGIRIWGSPVTPWFHDWAFNRARGAAIARHWALIPPGTDIVLVHGPAHGILDYTHTHIHAGCEELRKRLSEIRPAYVVSGHIHEAYGRHEEHGTRFINASVLNEQYRLRHPPSLFSLNR